MCSTSIFCITDDHFTVQTGEDDKEKDPNQEESSLILAIEDVNIG